MLKKYSRLISKLLVPFIYPLIVVIVGGWLLIPHTKEFLKEIIAYGFLVSILFCVSIIFSNPKIRRTVSLLFTFLLSSLAFTKLSFYYHYGVKLSASALFVIFETNTTESAEFLKYYLNSFSIFLALVLFLPWILLNWWPSIKSNSISNKILLPKWISVASVLWIIIAIFTIHKKFTDQNILYTGFTAYSEYQDTKAILKSTLAKGFSDYITVETSSDEPKTYIVVIGESTSSWHMQLYGYNRETNPLLSEIREELIIFKDVITPNVHTIVALDKILTLSDYNQPNIKENASIVQLANQAGFTTYWLSNQRPVGLHESMSTIIANAADQKYFMATDNFTSTIYDEVILPKLDTILKQPNAKKMIFIHLIGTHSDYKKRYPENFEHFQGRNTRTKIQHSNSEKIVNEYDNAVLYNDFIIRNIIESTRKEKKMAYLVYFSDHGDEVFDTMDLMGHNEYHGTKPMYEVPFLIWTSDEYKAKRPEFENMSQSLDRKYNLQDFIHSFSDLSEINFNLYDSSRSIFSPDFQERTRWIKKHEDFDKQK